MRFEQRKFSIERRVASFLRIKTNGRNRPEADRMIRTAIADFEFVVAASTPGWSKLSEHGRGELLGALADGWLLLGDVDKARPYLDRMAAELPDTPYARNAALHRADLAAKVPLTCLGCH